MIHQEKHPPEVQKRLFSIHHPGVKAFPSYRTETIFRWCHLVALGSTTWCQFSKGTFLCPWVIHTPNLRLIRQSILEFSHGNHFQMTRQHHLMPVFERNLPVNMSNPHTTFEVNRSKHSWVIAWKPFLDDVTWRCYQSCDASRLKQTAQKQYVPPIPTPPHPLCKSLQYLVLE